MRTIAQFAVVGLVAAVGPAVVGQSTAEAASIADAYRSAAERIIQATLAQNDGYTKLEELCDGIGHRLSGSPQLDQAIHWAADERDNWEEFQIASSRVKNIAHKGS